MPLINSIVAIMLFFSLCTAQAKSEIHSFHIVGKAQYRCFAGIDGKKLIDDRSGKPCDNKTDEATLIDKVISIEIKEEPNPEGSKDLVGQWSDNFKFKDRKFEIGLVLFKTLNPSSFRLRITANDNEPTHRKTTIFTDLKDIKNLNPLFIDYSSSGKKEEVNLLVEVKSTTQK